MAIALYSLNGNQSAKLKPLNISCSTPSAERISKDIPIVFVSVRVVLHALALAKAF